MAVPGSGYCVVKKMHYNLTTTADAIKQIVFFFFSNFKRCHKIQKFETKIKNLGFKSTPNLMFYVSI